MDNPLLRLQEAAKRLGLSTSKLYSMCARREIGHVRPGGPRSRIFIPESELQEHIRRCFKPARGMS
jgi:excisionase family DNA binding protein